MVARRQSPSFHANTPGCGGRPPGPPSPSASDEEFRAWRAHVRERVGIAIREIRREDEPDRKQIARQLADLPDRERFWGRDATIEIGGRGSKRR